MNVVIKVDDKTKEKLIEYYKDKLRDKVPPYAIFQAKEEDTIITLYNSGKVMFQGLSADVDANMWRAMDEKEYEEKIKEETSKFFYTSAIGSDEVGTGDYFGPIVVCAAYVKEEQIPELQKLGVNDSKKINDEMILKIAPKLIKLLPYKSIIISNEEYNLTYNKDNNMNKIKAIMHSKVLKALKNEITTKLDYIIMDEFTPEKKYYEYIKEDSSPLKGITFLQKAEDKNLAVASASIISRYIFLKEMDKLSDFYKIPIPKGAGANVDKIGQEIVDIHGKEVLDKIAKKNFSNTQRVLRTMVI